MPNNAVLPKQRWVTHLIAKGLLRWSIPMDVAVSCYCRRPRIYVNRSHWSRLENKAFVRMKPMTTTHLSACVYKPNLSIMQGQCRKISKCCPKVLTATKDNDSKGYEIPLIWWLAGKQHQTSYRKLNQKDIAAYLYQWQITPNVSQVRLLWLQISRLIFLISLSCSF